MNRAVQLFTFKNYCDQNPLEKEILECGAGVHKPEAEPLFVRFARDGYRVHGIDIAEVRLKNARTYCVDHHIMADLRQADMRAIPFDDASMPFIYAYNVIFHAQKEDMRRMVKEMARVLKPGGLMFVNFLSLDDGDCGQGERIGEGEFQQGEDGHTVVHSYHGDDEAEDYFEGLKVVFKEKRLLEKYEGEDWSRQAYIDYILKKPEL